MTKLKDDPRYKKPPMTYLPSKEPTASEHIAEKVKAAQRPRPKTCPHVWIRQSDASCKCVYCPMVRSVVGGKVIIK